jgi:DNA mismatch endonuclease (patch repair protein)
MARVKGSNTSPERILRAALWRSGLRYRLRARAPVARPDVVFPGSKVAVFVDGCFWHGCPYHYSRPRTREEFWSNKLISNVERDRKQTLQLEAMGWRVVRVWEHEIFGDIESVVEAVSMAVQGKPSTGERDWRVTRVVPIPEEGHDWELRELSLLRDCRQQKCERGPRKTGSDKKSLPTVYGKPDAH